MLKAKVQAYYLHCPPQGTGMRNSSNRTENTNQVLVVKRQKDDDARWREIGSSNISNTAACLSTMRMRFALGKR